MRLPLFTKGRRRSQAGDVLLFVLFSLLVLMLGALYLMREQFNETVVAGNGLQLQKNVQIGDHALALAVAKVDASWKDLDEKTTLESISGSNAWLFQPTGTEAWSAPGEIGSDNEAYWSQCGQGEGTSPCLRLCEQASALLPCDGSTDAATYYIAKMVVVPTNQPPDTEVCGSSGYVARFYSIFVHVQEAKKDDLLGPTAATMEGVYRHCVRA